MALISTKGEPCGCLLRFRFGMEFCGYSEWCENRVLVMGLYFCGGAKSNLSSLIAQRYSHRIAAPPGFPQRWRHADWFKISIVYRNMCLPPDSEEPKNPVEIA